MNPQKSPSLHMNNSPSIPWGSPALRTNASFPPMNRINTPSQRSQVQKGVRSFGPGMGSGSPKMGMPFYGSFRTPQPQPPQHSPNNPKAPWSDNRGQRGKRFQGNDSLGDSPRDSPSMNPGGSDNILHYYSPAMMNDPWLHTPPQPVDFWKDQ